MMFVQLSSLLPLLYILIGYLNQQVLGESLKIIDYALVELTFPEISEETEKFYGNVTLQFQCNLEEPPPDNIYLQASRERLKIEKVTFNGNILSEKEYGFENNDVLQIPFYDTNETFYIKIEYEGIISSEDDIGIYKRIFIEQNTTNVVIATNLEPSYSGRLFPNFVPLNKKLQFRFHITVPVDLTVIFNTGLQSYGAIETKGLREHIFYPTPIISASGLSFVIGNLRCSYIPYSKQVNSEICTNRNLNSNSKEFTEDVISKTMHFFDNFTQLNYTSYMNKISQIVFPVSEKESVARWGLISTGENNMFWNILDSSNSNKQKIASSIAKAIGKQWFGNLVTPQSTTDQILLVEGLSEYFQYVALNNIFPTWEVKKLFVTETLQVSMELDSYYSENQLISSKEMSKTRASSLLRMIKYFTQLEDMQLIIQRYLSKNLLGITNCTDFWKILEDQTENTRKYPDSIQNLMEQWIEGSVYPLLNVKSHGYVITISQESFPSNADKSKWYVPLTWTTSSEPNKFDSTKPNTWLKPDSDFQLTLDANWIILNNKETAYYRVNYDSILWSKIKSALLTSNFDGITETNRAQIVDDLFNLAKYGKIPYQESGGILSFLQYETSYFPWHSALRGYSSLLERVGENSTLGKAISNTFGKSLETVYDTITIPILYENEKSHIDALKTEQIVDWACRLGNQNCIEQVKKFFGIHIKYNITINRNVRKPIYCNALRYSNDTEEWEFMWIKFKNYSDDVFTKEYVLPALGCTKDVSLLNRYLLSVVNDKTLFTIEDVLTAIYSVIDESSEGILVARLFLLDNFKLIAERTLYKEHLRKIIVKIASKFTTRDELETFTNFMSITKLTSHQKAAFTEAIQIAEHNINWLETYRTDLEIFYMHSNTLGVSSPLYATFLFCIYLFINFCVFNRDAIIPIFVRGYEERLDEISLYSFENVAQ